ncbi:hypothetical protein BJ742DRAFT_844435 [Cladochytrium replicatum]|nr:hypothetical protein BJ742DRAFT_844435 [Cladochytrium replicatum]
MVKDVPVETIPSLVKSISDPIVTAAPERAHLRLKILSNLYNSLEHTSPARHDVYLSIVEVASKSDELDTLVPTFAHLDEWVVLWGIPLNKTRDLYRLLSEKLANTKAFKRRGYEFALKLLTTYESSDAKALSSVSEDAIRAVELAVKIPVVLNFEPLHALGSVQALKTAKNGKDVFELLKIFMDGNLKSYKTFVEKKGDFIKKHGFSNEDNIYKMRLLSLASLAANHVQGEVSYDVIATELNIDEDDVEMWVIDGIRAGLIEAKMNQLKRTILVSRATQRIFRKEQWDALGSKLDAWKVHLDDMLQVIANAKLLAIQGIDDIPAQ